MEADSPDAAAAPEPGNAPPAAAAREAPAAIAASCAADKGRSGAAAAPVTAAEAAVAVKDAASAEEAAGATAAAAAAALASTLEAALEAVEDVLPAAAGRRLSLRLEERRSRLLVAAADDEASRLAVLALPAADLGGWEDGLGDSMAAAAAAANAGCRGAGETADASSSPSCRLLEDVALDSREHSASMAEPPAVEPSPPTSALLPPLPELQLLDDDADWSRGEENGSTVELGSTLLTLPPEPSAEAPARADDHGKDVGLLEDPGAGVSASMAGARSTSEAPAGAAGAAPTAGVRAQEERCDGTSPPSPKRHKLVQAAGWPAWDAWGPGTPRPSSPRRARGLAVLLPPDGGTGRLSAEEPRYPEPRLNLHYSCQWSDIATMAVVEAAAAALLLTPTAARPSQQQSWANSSAGNACRGPEPSDGANACEHGLRGDTQVVVDCEDEQRQGKIAAATAGDQVVVDGEGEKGQEELMAATAGGRGSAGGDEQSPLAAVGEVGSTAHPVAAASVAAGPAATKPRRRGRPPGRKRAGNADADGAASPPEATSSDTLKLLGDLKYLLKAALHSKQAEAAARLTMYCLRSSVVAERDIGPAGAREALTAMMLASPGSFLARGAATLLEVWQP
eukprot:SM000012S25418  [mRNA]  locus=s12:1023019:1025694:+ [translate_table: standard]